MSEHHFLHHLQINNHIANGYQAPPALQGELVVADLETSGLDSSEAEIIEIAAIKVIDGQLYTDEVFQTLVKPTQPISRKITKLTGITNEELSAQGVGIAEAIDAFLAFVGGRDVVFYNSPFDVKFIKAAPGGDAFGSRVFDALPIARRAWPELSSHKLGLVGEHIDVQLEEAHRAIPDTILLYYVLFSAASTLGLDNLALAPSKTGPYAKVANAKLKDLDVNETGPLAGEFIVFTGELTIDRSIAQAFSASLGAKPTSGVGKKTTLVVVSDDDIDASYALMTSKHKKAFDLVSEGSNIRILSESDFISLVASHGHQYPG